MSTPRTPKRRSHLKLSVETTAEQTPLESPTRTRMQLQSQISCSLITPPPCIQNHWLYEKTLADVTRLRSLESKLTVVNTEEIDRALSRHLKREEQQTEFKRKFGSRDDPRARTKRRGSLMSDTRMEKDRQLLKKLMNNPEDRGKIYENSLLQEYYLKDLEKNKTNIHYLKKDFAIVKHRKLTATKKDNEELHMSHDESEVQHVKLLNYVKHQKQIQQAVKRAKKNITYRKSLNLQRINYLIECMVVKPLAANPIKYPPEINQSHIMIMRRLFFRYSNAQGPETTLYTYITMDRLCTLFERLNLPSISPQYPKELFNKLVKYKTEKVIFYYDYIEVLSKASLMVWPGQRKSKALADIVDNYVRDRKEMYTSYIEILLEFYWKEISAFGSKTRINYCLETIYWSMADKLEYGTLFTQSCVFQALTSFGLIQAIQREKVLFYYKYMCVREEGLTLPEFIRSLYLIAISQQLQMYKVKAEHMRKTTQSFIAKNDATQLIEHLHHYFFDKIKLVDKIIC